MHDRKRFNVFLYATSPTDGSSYRQYYERQTDFHFNDVSSWSIGSTIEKIMLDQIHIRKQLDILEWIYITSVQSWILVVTPKVVETRYSLQGHLPFRCL